MEALIIEHTRINPYDDAMTLEMFAQAYGAAVWIANKNIIKAK